MLDKRNFYINGKWVKPTNPNDFEVINPSTEETCAVISLGSKEDTDIAVNAAKEALVNWRESSKDERISLLEKLLSIYKKRYGERNPNGQINMRRCWFWKDGNSDKSCL